MAPMYFKQLSALPLIHSLSHVGLTQVVFLLLTSVLEFSVLLIHKALFQLSLVNPVSIPEC